MTEGPPLVTGGVDTHADFHVAAVTDPVGRVLGTEQFPATKAGYAGPAALGCGQGRRPCAAPRPRHPGGGHGG
jgi:hypothetical protein